MELFTKRRVSKVMVTKEWDSTAGLRLMALKMIMSHGISRKKTFGEGENDRIGSAGQPSAPNSPPIRADKALQEDALRSPIQDIDVDKKLFQPEKRDCATQTAAVYVCF
mmetsp:Transcript_849/g.1395  ORF Transcript_849/g.1395 Transcript_849/m.1395 type:complete len:109 (-) Transcript_849:145-471(-)